jgi:hypothetical protein
MAVVQGAYGGIGASVCNGDAAGGDLRHHLHYRIRRHALRLEERALCISGGVSNQPALIVVRHIRDGNLTGTELVSDLILRSRAEPLEQRMLGALPSSVLALALFAGSESARSMGLRGPR